jgi:hypothetical protein
MSSARTAQSLSVSLHRIDLDRGGRGVNNIRVKVTKKNKKKRITKNNKKKKL